MTDIEKYIETTLGARIGESYKDVITYVDNALKDMESLSADALTDIYPQTEISYFEYKQYTDIIDELKLTRKEYEDAEKYLKKCLSHYNKMTRTAYYKARTKINDALKEMLRANSFSYTGKNKDKVFDLLYTKAYDKSHSYDYAAIQATFEELDDIIYNFMSIVEEE